jgi:hypothetical protein
MRGSGWFRAAHRRFGRSAITQVGRWLRGDRVYELHEPVLTSLAPDALVALVSPRSSAAAP